MMAGIMSAKIKAGRSHTKPRHDQLIRPYCDHVRFAVPLKRIKESRTPASKDGSRRGRSGNHTATVPPERSPEPVSAGVEE
jgi:hypothetical protein